MAYPLCFPSVSGCVFCRQPVCRPFLKDVQPLEDLRKEWGKFSGLQVFKFAEYLENLPICQQLLFPGPPIGRAASRG